MDSNQELLLRLKNALDLVQLKLKMLEKALDVLEADLGGGQYLVKTLLDETPPSIFSAVRT